MFILLQRILPKHLLSRFVGWIANSEISVVKNLFIRVIIAKYKVDLSEAEESDPAYYKSFNQFFARKLISGARPLSGRFCSPADGVISALGHIENNQLVQAKGINYSLEKLLANTAIEPYSKGSFMTIYLAPKDYHRVHCPHNAKLISAKYVPGNLFSVNSATTEGVTDLFADNERLVMEFETSSGKMAVIMVGALIVAAIQSVWNDKTYQVHNLHLESFDPPMPFEKGDELGQFQMGSTAIVLLEEKVEWKPSCHDPVKMGEALVI